MKIDHKVDDFSLSNVTEAFDHDFSEHIHHFGEFFKFSASQRHTYFWKGFTPYDLENNCSLIPGRIADVVTYISHQKQKTSFISFFQEDFDRKMDFYENFCDIFLIQKNQITEGILIFHPLDWSTYYFRFAHISVKLRGMGLYRKTLEFIIAHLKLLHCSRLELDTAPDNLSHLKILSDFQFIQTGMMNSERWGGLMRMTCYISPEARNVFKQKFCKEA